MKSTTKLDDYLTTEIGQELLTAIKGGNDGSNANEGEIIIDDEIVN